jgi:uncharacterized lipoprotein
MKLKNYSLLILLTLSGCAFTKGYVAIDYVPSSQAEILEEAQNVKVQVHVCDNRENKEIIGHKKNGYGIRMAPILATNNLETLLKDAIRQGLANQGFIITEGAGFTVEAEIKKMYNNFKMHLFSTDGEGEVIFATRVLSPEGEELFAEDILAKEIRKPCFVMGETNAKKSVESAFATAVSNLITNKNLIDTLLEKRQIHFTGTAEEQYCDLLN